MIATRATQTLGIEYPVVLARMGGGTKPELVAAVSEAGGLGILATGSVSTLSQSGHSRSQRS